MPQKPKTACFFLGILLLLLPGAYSQSTYLPSGHEWHDFVQRMEIKSGGTGPGFHFALQPLERKSMVEFLEFVDTTNQRITATDKNIIYDIIQSNAEWTSRKQDSSRRPLLRHFYQTPTSFYQYHDEELFLSINPVIHFETGMEKGRDLWLYQNTRGVEVRGMINQKVGFYSYLTDNQARFPQYVNHKIQEQEGAIPGEGWNIPFGEQGYDFFTARGYIAFQATKNIGLQFGHDRSFLGFGKRSLLLSDYGNNYLFLKINTRLWRFHYQNTFARLVDFPLRTYGGRLFDAKYMAAHTLSFKVSDRFQLGLFENVVFGRSDTLSRRGFDAHYLNPIIFYRAVEHHIGDPDKVSIGLFWRWIAGHHLSFYGQVYADDFHIGDLKYDLDSLLTRVGFRSQRKHDKHASFRNKFGLQAGMHWVDMLGLSNLDFQLEGNWVRPFVYTHFDVDGSGQRPAANYTHYSQALAHPLGANFRELVAGLKYTPHPDWQFQTRIFSARQGVDSAGINMGSDITADYTTRQGDYGHTFLQGDKRSWMIFQVETAWQWRPNIWINLRYVYRNEELENHDPQTTGLFMVGLRMNALQREHWF